jgi:hypothetical protein
MRHNMLTKLVVVMGVLLFAQYALRSAITLFIEVPIDNPFPYAYVNGAVVAAHVTLHASENPTRLK